MDSKMTPDECLAQLGAALLGIQQMSVRADDAKMFAFGLGALVGAFVCGAAVYLFYEWRYCAALAWQRKWERQSLLPADSVLANKLRPWWSRRRGKS